MSTPVGEEEPTPHHHLPKVADDPDDDEDNLPGHPTHPRNPFPQPHDYPPPHYNHRTPTPPPRHPNRTHTPPPPPPPQATPSPPPPPTPLKPRPPPTPSPPPPHHKPPPAYDDYYDDDDDRRNNLRRRICAVIVTLFVLIGIAALVLWLIYRPHKPNFTAVAAAVYALNVTSPPFISASVQLTVLTRNPNKRTSLHYDGLTATVYYRNHPITPPLNLPPLVHRRRSAVMMSPIIGGGGAAVPVPGDVANGLAADEVYGVVGLSWVLNGRVRYKAGWFRSGHSGVYVRCDVLVALKGGGGGGGGGGGRGVFNNPGGQVPLLGTPPCLVDM